MKQAEIFEQEGLPPAKVCLGHSDDTNDIDYLTGLLRRGYAIGMDHMTWGIQPTEGATPDVLSWQQRAECVKKLIDAGYGSKIFLSNDWYFGISIAEAGFMKAKEKMNPDGMLFTTRKVLPYLNS